MSSNRSPRSRSTTSGTTSISSGHRPVSRQSTTSIQSNSAPPTASHTGTSYLTGAGMPSTIWQQHQDAQSQAVGVHYMVDSSIHPHAHGTFGHDSAGFQASTGMHMGPPAQIAPMERKENVPFSVGIDSSMVTEHVTDGSKRKKGSATSQANDNELRRLFRENENRDLHDVALQVTKDEKGPKAEKTKQIFGMLWLSQNTKRSSSSVPRNRVFTSYATRCGTERVPPLNPASFGKLVRIIFPGITTRRLGVRGESKYHYVELSLIDESRSEHASIPRERSVTTDSQHEITTPTVESSKEHLPADTASFSPGPSPRRKSYWSNKSIFTTSNLYPQTSTWGERNSNPTSMMRRPLLFTFSKSATSQADSLLELPSIDAFIPPGTDVDAVNSLTSVYRSHCLLAIDNFRYCKTDKLCDSYKSLVGLLTVPGQKLLSHPNIAAWIRACDWMKYQKMIPMLDAILLTQVPKRAMAHMEHVSQNICSWITQFFQNQPRHTQEAMLGPTNIFASLLERFLRVNRAALDVAQVLEDQGSRDELWRDWMSHMKPLHVLQNSLLDHGHKRVLHVLTQEARFLLSPVESDSFANLDPLFVDTGVLSDFQREQTEFESSKSSSISIIGRLSRFLQSLAPRFPGVDARSLLNHIDVVGNNISRNLTLNGASSLGNWWRVKLFIDEMSYWLAEKGGFLGTNPGALDTHLVGQTIRTIPALSNTQEVFCNSRPTSSTSAQVEIMPDMQEYSVTGNEESLPPYKRYNKGHGTQIQAHTNPEAQSNQVPPRSRSESTVVEEEDGIGFGDDSGIAMGLEDEFGIDTKYNSFVEGVNGSDPADVVVC